VRLAHRFALENENVRADCIESTEFPDLAAKYRVYAVPRTLINESAAVEGAVPESFLLDAILKALPPVPPADEAGT
jgi:predicted DsbA family dithiol-disulfide isomerase